MPARFRQAFAFALAGACAAFAHYGALIALVEIWGMAPVPATLIGYVAGGAASYALNRGNTFRTERSHAQALWRFVLVAGAGFVITYALMTLLQARLGLPYLPAQLMTTAATLAWSFQAHRLYTFADHR